MPRHKKGFTIIVPVSQPADDRVLGLFGQVHFTFFAALSVNFDLLSVKVDISETESTEFREPDSGVKECYHDCPVSGSPPSVGRAKVEQCTDMVRCEYRNECPPNRGSTNVF